jgi:tetrahydromethanopterin S-methyltransferase subunit G
MLLLYAQQLVAKEQQLANAEQRLDEIDRRALDATEELQQLPPPSAPAPPLTD